jgi:hypothetical protein
VRASTVIYSCTVQWHIGWPIHALLLLLLLLLLRSSVFGMFLVEKLYSVNEYVVSNDSICCAIRAVLSW